MFEEAEPYHGNVAGSKVSTDNYVSFWGFKKITRIVRQIMRPKSIKLLSAIP